MSLEALVTFLSWREKYSHSKLPPSLLWLYFSVLFVLLVWCHPSVSAVQEATVDILVDILDKSLLLTSLFRDKPHCQVFRSTLMTPERQYADICCFVFFPVGVEHSSVPTWNSRLFMRSWATINVRVSHKWVKIPFWVNYTLISLDKVESRS